MLLKYVYDKALAHASYLVGCQRAKTAVIVDPGRDIEQYLELARSEGVTITAVAETHIHADYVSGARELAERVGAKLYLSKEGPAEWQYLFADQYDHQLVGEGDHFMVGNIRFDVMHTPGHTPESISFLLTDVGGNANRPMGIFTGDFVFVGSIGRPDLLEEAAGMAGTAEAGAHDLFHSAQRFKQLPDFLQVWPAHGAGSACGKGLGAVPSSTVGYEKLFNPAMQIDDENAFVQYILADQPEAPKYFAVMKRVNKEGPAILGDPPLPRQLSASDAAANRELGTLLDLTPSPDYARGFVPGSLNIPLSMLAGWAGWLLDYDRPVTLVTSENALAEATRILHKIGVEDIQGYVTRESLQAADLLTGSYPNATPAELESRIDSGDVVLLDVRSQGEWEAGTIPGARHYFLGKLPNRLEELDKSRTYVTQCQSGARSAIAASLLTGAGLDVVNMQGGYSAWTEAGLKTNSSSKDDSTGGCSTGCATELKTTADALPLNTPSSPPTELGSERLEALHRLLDRADDIVRMMDDYERLRNDVPHLAAMSVDIVDERVRKAGEAGIDVEERTRAVLQLLLQFTEENKLAELEKLLTRLPLANQGLEMLENGAPMLAMFVDVFDEWAADLQGKGIDLETSVKQGVQAALWLGQRITQEDLDRLGVLLHSAVLDEHAIEAVGMAGQALARCQQGTCETEKPARAGVWDSIKALRSPEVQRSLAYLLRFATCFGRSLEEKHA